MAQLANELLQVLEASRQDVNRAVDSLAHEQTIASPGPDRWSVLQCMEHIVAVEERFLERIRKAERTPEPRIEPERAAEFALRARNREERRQAPDAVIPNGRFATVTDALRAFNEVRQQTNRFAEEQDDALYSLSITHPKFGVMNGVEVLRLIAGHAERHAEQIREVLSGQTK